MFTCIELPLCWDKACVFTFTQLGCAICKENKAASIFLICMFTWAMRPCFSCRTAYIHCSQVLIFYLIRPYFLHEETTGNFFNKKKFWVFADTVNTWFFVLKLNASHAELFGASSQSRTYFHGHMGLHNNAISEWLVIFFLYNLNK